jgi:hypothetical protein
LYRNVEPDLVKFLKNNKETLKDLDFVNLSQRYKNLLRIKISDEDRKTLLDVIEKDSKFLCENDLMDYSVLMGIEIVSDKKNDKNFETLMYSE